MGNPYKYHFRPAYGSKELLLEFYQGVEKDDFQSDLLKTISEINPKIDSIEWIDGDLLNINSNLGSFTLSIDIWGLAFIMGEKNQDCLKRINEILSTSTLFEKIEVDFEKYKLTK